MRSSSYLWHKWYILFQAMFYSFLYYLIIAIGTRRRSQSLCMLVVGFFFKSYVRTSIPLFFGRNLWSKRFSTRHMYICCKRFLWIYGRGFIIDIYIFTALAVLSLPFDEVNFASSRKIKKIVGRNLCWHLKSICALHSHVIALPVLIY